MCKGNVYDNWRFMRQVLEPWAFDISRIYLPEIEPWATETESERPFGMYGDQIKRRYLPDRCFPQDLFYPCMARTRIPAMSKRAKHEFYRS